MNVSLPKISVLVVVLFSLTINTSALAPPPLSKDSLSFMMITQRQENDAFWGVVGDIALATANQFNIKLHLRHAQSDRENMLKFVDEAADRGMNAIIFPNFKNIAPDLLKRAEQRKIHTFLMNASIAEKNLSRIGKPREKFEYWLGQSMPDDEQAGYLLATQLVGHARKQNLIDADGKVQITGIAGTLSEMPSLLRKQGLERAAANDQGVLLNQVVFANWSKQLAKKKMHALYKRYPDTSVFWAASDLMAIGVAQGIKEINLSTKHNILTGGIDWTVEGLQALNSNVLSASIGGHIFEGAWIITLLYDYFKGVDFMKHLPVPVSAPYVANANLVLPMRSIEKNKAKGLLDRIQNKDWNNLDFAHFSRFSNPGHAGHYDFSVEHLLDL